MRMQYIGTNTHTRAYTYTQHTKICTILHVTLVDDVYVFFYRISDDSDKKSIEIYENVLRSVEKEFNLDGIMHIYIYFHQLSIYACTIMLICTYMQIYLYIYI